MSRDYLTGVRRALIRLLTETSKLVNENPLPPFPPESLAAIERAECKNPSLDTAVTIPQVLLESSAEHLEALVGAISEPVKVIVSCTCVRSMLEPSALAAWILDPRIDGTTRVGRVFALRYEGMAQHAKAARALGATQAEVDAIIQRIKQVEQDALKLGYPPIHDKTGRLIGIAQRMPGATDLIEVVLEEQKIYRVLSAVSHGHSWATRQLCYEQAGRDGQFWRFEKTVSIDGIAWQALAAARALGRALWHRCLYLGGDREALTKLLEQTFHTLGAASKARFWRRGYDL